MDSQVKAFHIWHRHQQLPLYAQFLRHVDQFAKDELSPEELQSIIASVEKFRVLLARQASPPGAEFMAMVTPSQIQHLEEALDQDYRRLVSEAGNESEKRLVKRIAVTSENLTNWVGELSVEQEAYIRERVEEIPDATDVWLAYRRNRQKKLLDLLRSSHDPLILERGLYQWMADWKTGTTAESLPALEEWREEITQAVLDIDRMLTRDQRAHFSRKLEGLIQEIQGLVG